MNQPDLVVCRLTLEGGDVLESMPKTPEEAEAWYRARQLDGHVITSVEYRPTPQMQLLA